jgi:glycosyltransferase involved in cell wall biosynthesis
MPRRYVFWQPIPSMHQLPFLEALAVCSGAEVVCLHAEELPPDRLALGWMLPKSPLVQLHSANTAASKEMIRSHNARTLHVFSGFHCHPILDERFSLANSLGARTAVISEAYDPRGVRGLLRRARSVVDARRYGHRIDALFAMGELGTRWFRGAGFPPGKVFPFAYVVETPTPGAPQLAASDFQMAFVGRFVHLKGLDSLLRALASSKDLPWRLVIIGEGPLERVLRDLATRFGIASRIQWLGALPNPRVSEVLAASDLLVLPSRKDGWGAVVNEALTVGTPVVCSSACGAADLIQDSLMGETFAPTDLRTLATIIKNRIHTGRPSELVRRQVVLRSQAFAPPSVANYFLEVIRSLGESATPPKAPWRQAFPTS